MAGADGIAVASVELADDMRRLAGWRYPRTPRRAATANPRRPRPAAVG
jgi:hypothetical protein